MKLLRLREFYYLMISTLLLLSCAVGPDFQAPQSPKSTSYTSTPLPEKTVAIKGEEEKTQQFVSTQEISRQWWNLFQCNPLSELVQRGLHNSPNLQAAQASLRQAEANLKSGMGGFFPSVDAQIGAAREKESTVAFGIPGPPLTFNLFNVSVNVSYIPDIFGALRRQVEALDAQVDYQRFELEAAYLTLTSNIVTTAIREASVRAQIEVTKELIAFQEKQLEIIKLELPLGGVSQRDILAQETIVAQTRATLPPLANSLAQTRHALAILVGDLPSEATLPVFKLDDLHLPKDLPIALPAALVQNRPDIKAAEALLHQANAQIGLARANMFPQLIITGSAGGLTNLAPNLFAGSSDVWSIGANLLQPLFRGGAMIAKEKAATAAYEQSFAQYRQTVLQSFQQVADVLTALVEDAKTHKALTESEKSSHDSLELSRKQYKLGAISLLTLLNIERQYQQTRIGLIQSEAARYADTAALFQALGGDCFSLRPSPSHNRDPENQETECTKESKGS